MRQKNLKVNIKVRKIQTEVIRKITAVDDIDLTLPATKPCAYYCIMSDQHTTLNFISTLFFTFLFMDLVEFADMHGGQSRKAAIEKIAARNFNKRKYDGKAEVNIDDIVEATVISVGQNAIWVNVRGFDISIPKRLLTHQYVDDCRNIYEPGQTIKVYIKDVNYNSEGVALGIEASAKLAELPDFIPRLQNIKSGMHMLGTITSISKSKKVPGQTNIRLFLNSFNVPAIAVYTQMIDTVATSPRTGDVVVFSVHSVKEDSGYVLGSIKRRA